MRVRPRRPDGEAGKAYRVKKVSLSNSSHATAAVPAFGSASERLSLEDGRTSR